MNELPLSPDDEIVSAVLDGEATAAERARVAAEPALQQRLAELQQVHEAVATPVAPLDELALRRLLDRALGAADPRDGARSVNAGGRPAPVRTDRRWWQSGVGLGIGSAAAVVLLALLAGPAMLEGLGGDDDESADVAATSAGDDSPPNLVAESAGDAAGEALADSDADDSADRASEDEGAFGAIDGAASDPGVVRWIGSFDTVEAFADGARAELTAFRLMADNTSPAPTTTAAVTAPDTPSAAIQRYAARCSSTVLDEFVSPDSQVARLVSGQIGDRQVLGIWVVDDASDLSLIGLDIASCEEVDLG